MKERTYSTPLGKIHYWVHMISPDGVTLVFLPGLTADHRLFDKQIVYFQGKYNVLVWDAPGHAASWPFAFDFDLMDKARWLDGILEQEGITKPVIVGQSMGGYVGQAYAQTYPEKLKGFVSIDSAPLQRKYMTKPELWLLKRMEIVYRCYPWKALLKSGTKGVALSEYGRNLMRDMMLVYDGDQKRYAKIAGHGFRILAEAVERDLPYEIKCPALLICGEQDKAGSCVRYNKAWHKNIGHTAGMAQRRRTQLQHRPAGNRKPADRTAGSADGASGDSDFTKSVTAKRRCKRMWSYIAGGVFLALAMYFLVQGIRCGAAVRESKNRLAAYNARTAALSYGDITYVDSGEGEVILSVHGIFGGYDQAYDTCKDFCSDYRIIAPSRFGYLGSDVSGDGTPARQAAAYVELLDKLGIDKVHLLATSAGGSVAIRFALDYPQRTKGLILYCSAMPPVEKPERICRICRAASVPVQRLRHVPVKPYV